MKPIAVVYATREGHTRKVAAHVAMLLSSRGLEVHVINILEDGAVDLMRYAGVVIAASVHVGRHEPEMVRFVKKHRAELDFLPTLFLSVCLAEAALERPGQKQEIAVRSAIAVQGSLNRFRKQTGWRPKHVHAVAGALPFTRYNPLLRWMMKMISRSNGVETDTSQDYEYTDWSALDSFAEAFAAELTTG